ncbi:MAG: replication initiation protein [Lachnospiraceae bacterium]|nr:replication initiation protein [Lachnospiraceae bacterium]
MKENTSLARAEDYYDESDTYTRSNFMISSKYRSTLFSNRLMAISLSRLGSAKESEDGYLSVSIKGKDIQSLFGVKGNSFFTQLSNTAQGMTGQTIGWSNPETQEFEYIAVVTKAKYQAGEFTIDFHKDIRNFLTDLKNNYTRFSLSVMLKFKSTYSFRMYELLRSKTFYKKGEERDNNLFKIEFDINELRLDLGVVNAEIMEVRKVLNKSKGKPDYAKAVEASPEKLFSDWSNFRRKVIETAIKEINGLPETGIYIHRYEPKKAGQGGKVYAVVFYVELIGKKKKAEIIDMNEQNYDDLIDEIRDLISDIKSREARAIGEAAKWDMDLIERNFEYSKTKDVDDIVGFMIKAVKEDWAQSAKKPRGRSKSSKGTGFSDFSGRNYDYDELMASIGDNI